MNTRNKPVIPWLLVVWCLGMASILAACGVSASTAAATSVIPATPVPTETPSLRLEDGAVEVQDEKHDWLPIGGETTFELVGELESNNPWMVTHNTFAVRDSTQITEGLEPGDLVKVKGVILQDATWLAETIEPLEENVDPAITLIGKVSSIDPWVVSGIKLDVTADTVVTGKIAPEMIVRVDILLLEDGSWEILSIAPLSTFTEIPGCATVTATVASVNGKEVRFAGWPAITLNENIKVENEAGNQVALTPNRMVLVVVCLPEQGQFMITKIIVLQKSDASANGERVLVCHKPDKQGGHTLSIPTAAVPAHLHHGDKLGRCP